MLSNLQECLQDLSPLFQQNLLSASGPLFYVNFSFFLVPAPFFPLFAITLQLTSKAVVSEFSFHFFRFFLDEEAGRDGTMISIVLPSLLHTSTDVSCLCICFSYLQLYQFVSSDLEGKSVSVQIQLFSFCFRSSTMLVFGNSGL